MLKVKSDTGNDEDLNLLLNTWNRGRFKNHRKRRKEFKRLKQNHAEDSNFPDLSMQNLSRRTFNFFSQDNQFKKFNDEEEEDVPLPRKRKRPRKKRPRPQIDYPDPKYVLPMRDYDDFLSAEHRQSVPFRPQIVRVDYNLESNRIVAPILLAFMPIFLGVGTALGLLLSGYSFSGSSSTGLTLGGNNVTVLLTNTVSAPSTSSATNTNTNTNNINTAGRSWRETTIFSSFIEKVANFMQKKFGIRMSPDAVEAAVHHILTIYKNLTIGQGVDKNHRY